MGKVGPEYWRTRDMDIAEIAKLVRADIAKLDHQGKASVKIDRYRGGQSIKVGFTKQGKSIKVDNATIYWAIQFILDKYNFDFSSGGCTTTITTVIVRTSK